MFFESGSGISSISEKLEKNFRRRSRVSKSPNLLWNRQGFERIFVRNTITTRTMFVTPSIDTDRDEVEFKVPSTVLVRWLIIPEFEAHSSSWYVLPRFGPTRSDVIPCATKFDQSGDLPRGEDDRNCQHDTSPVMIGKRHRGGRLSRRRTCTEVG